MPVNSVPAPFYPIVLPWDIPSVSPVLLLTPVNPRSTGLATACWLSPRATCLAIRSSHASTTPVRVRRSERSVSFCRLTCLHPLLLWVFPIWPKIIHDGFFSLAHGFYNPKSSLFCLLFLQFHMKSLLYISTTLGQFLSSSFSWTPAGHTAPSLGPFLCKFFLFSTVRFPADIEMTAAHEASLIRKLHPSRFNWNVHAPINTY